MGSSELIQMGRRLLVVEATAQRPDRSKINHEFGAKIGRAPRRTAAV
jgi:hypothetical protein